MKFEYWGLFFFIPLIIKLLNLDVSMPKVERKIVKKTVNDIKVKKIEYIIFFILI